MPLSVFIIGQKWFGGEVLGLCAARGHHIAGACAPGGGDRLWTAAADHGVKVIASGSLHERAIPEGVDLIICAHAHCFVPASVRNRARLGAIGYHPSLLPRHRGRDAVRWVIHMREAITGGTVYWMNDVADAGPIAAQRACHVAPGATAQSLWREQLAPLGLELIGEVLDDIERGVMTRTEQDEAVATFEPAFTRAALRDGGGG